MRGTGAVFLLSLPIGYYPESSDSTDLLVGVHGGVGQVATVLRDCSGDAYYSETTPYSDVGGYAYAPLYIETGTTLMPGVRGGHWNASDSGLADTALNFGYVNPSLSLESRSVGLGLGFVLGDARWDLDSDSEPIRYSGHVRLGSLRKGYIILSVAEATPLISGGGPFVLGLGYPFGTKARALTGLSAGFYDGLGVLQQVQIRVNNFYDVGATFRGGWSAGEFEGSIGVGVVFQLGRGKSPARHAAQRSEDEDDVEQWKRDR